MGRTKPVACPSAVLLLFVATKPYYTIVPVFVKVSSLLLDMFRPGMLVLVVLGGICSLSLSHRFHRPGRERLGAVLWERERNVGEPTGSVANRRAQGTDTYFRQILLSGMEGGKR